MNVFPKETNEKSNNAAQKLSNQVKLLLRDYCDDDISHNMRCLKNIRSVVQFNIFDMLGAIALHTISTIEPAKETAN